MTLPAHAPQMVSAAKRVCRRHARFSPHTHTHTGSFSLEYKHAIVLTILKEYKRQISSTPPPLPSPVTAPVSLILLQNSVS